MYRSILVAVAPDHPETVPLMLKAARALCAPGGTIGALTVLEQVPAYVAPYMPEGQEVETRTALEAQLAVELADAPDVARTVLRGHAGNTILEHAATIGAECIILASHRPELSDYFLGSTAARVVRHAPCSVHVIR